MCPWLGPRAPSFGRQLWGLPSRDQCIANDARNVDRSGRAEGWTGSVGASGGAVPGRPPPPQPGWPAGGRPHQAHGAAPRLQPNAYTRGECAGDERGAG